MAISDLCGVCYNAGDEIQLVARDLAVPTHIFSTVESVRTILERYGSDVGAGDVFLVCDPYMGGTHIPDWTVIRPVFIGARPAFFTIVRGHINDAGGPMPGNYNAEARDMWQEGFRIPPLRIVRAGEPVADRPLEPTAASWTAAVQAFPIAPRCWIRDWKWTNRAS